MYFFHRTGFGFVRAHAVNTTHENVAEYRSISSTGKQIRIQMEAGVAFDARHINGDNRDLRHSGFFQRAPDEAYVVGGTAAPAGLRHDDGYFI